MAVAHDNGQNVGNVLTWSHTCNGSNRYLTVQVMIGSNTVTSTGVTYAGVAMTLLHREQHATQPITAELWGLANPASGANTIVVTQPGSPGCDNGSASFTGVNQATPTDGAAAGTQANPATNVTSAAKTGTRGGDMMVACAGSSQVMTISTGTDSWNSGANGDACAYLASDGTSQTIVWTAASGNWACSVALLKAAVEPPVFRAAGAKSAGTTGALTVSAPTGVATGDLEILVASTIAGGTISISSNGGSAWTAMTNTPIDVTSGEKLYVWYRVRQAGDTDPQVTPGSDHVCAARLAYTAGTFNTSTPIAIAVNGSEVTSDTSFSFAPGTTTPSDSCLVLCISTSGTDSNTAQVPVCTNSSLTLLASRANYETLNGGGGGFGITEGVKGAAGTTGTFACTYASASPKAYVSFAIQPAATTDAITPAAINATSAVTAGVVKLAAVKPAAVNATSTLSGTVVALKHVTPAAISSTSSMTASLVALRAVKPAAISSTSSLTGTVTKRVPIVPNGFTSTSTLSAAVVAQRAVSGSVISGTSSLSASVTKVGGGGPKSIVPAAINGTSQVTTSLVMQRLLNSINITATSTVGGNASVMRPAVWIAPAVGVGLAPTVDRARMK